MHILLVNVCLLIVTIKISFFRVFMYYYFVMINKITDTSIVCYFSHKFIVLDNKTKV